MASASRSVCQLFGNWLPEDQVKGDPNSWNEKADLQSMGLDFGITQWQSIKITGAAKRAADFTTQKRDKIAASDAIVEWHACNNF
jgi:hypothetical protein